MNKTCRFNLKDQFTDIQAGERRFVQPVHGRRLFMHSFSTPGRLLRCCMEQSSSSTGPSGLLQPSGRLIRPNYHYDMNYFVIDRSGVELAATIIQSIAVLFAVSGDYHASSL